MSPPSPASSAKKTYDRRFGRSPELIAIAPGRVNLIGDHVDYAGGLVMPMAIDCCTAVAVGRDPEATDEPSVIVAADLDVECKIDLGEIQSPRQPGTPDAFLNYVTGPLEQIRKAGVSLPRMDLVIASSVPMGGGLSSSAALEIAVLLAVRTLLERKTSPLELALEAQRAEHEQAGTPCGIMDMYVSAAARPGHACMIDCMTNELRQVRMPPEDEAVVMVTDTRTRHELNDGAYATRREQCEEAARMLGVDLLGQASIAQVHEAGLPGTIDSRARHVVEEIARVLDFAGALERGDLETAGDTMFSSHDSLRDLYEVSCPELDLLVETARDHRGRGVYGSRMTGGGFGGCTVTLCRKEFVDELETAFRTAFQDAFGHEPESFITSAGAGAHVM
ncbi:MAG: galactokinase [Phycisphaerales bacterium]|jgi:galactokinase|nr:galactokinase [Phycisphaerales bacterium]